MKTIVLLISLVITGLCASAQARMYYTKEEIKSEYAAVGIVCTEGIEDGIKYLATETSEAWVFYYLHDETGECFATVISPKTQSIMASTILRYNTNYVATSNTNWIAYTDGQVFKIELVYVQDRNYYYFIWTL